MTSPQLPVFMRRDLFDPDPELAALRRDQPVSRVRLPMGSAAWLVTRYEDVRAVLGDPALFSNVIPGPQPDGPDAQDTAGLLLGLDPPEHTRLRRMLTGAFTVRRMERLRPRIERIVHDQLDVMAGSGSPADLVESFALPVPSLVISELLGVPAKDQRDFQRRTRLRMDLSLPTEERIEVGNAARAYMADLVARRRAEPTDDLIGTTLTEHGAELTDAELVGMADLLLLAGHDTTANMLGLGTLLLLRHPEQLARVRDSDEAAEWAVEEMLRHLSVTYSTFQRYATRDTVLGGQRIAAGDGLVCSLLSANRDPALGAGLDQFDISRRTPGHFAFGYGVHHCIGAPLARVQLRIAYPALLRRFGGLRLAVPIDQIPFNPFSFVYGVSSLPVAW